MSDSFTESSIAKNGKLCKIETAFEIYLMAKLIHVALKESTINFKRFQLQKTTNTHKMQSNGIF